jgi:sialate O-acetylesterase
LTCALFAGEAAGALKTNAIFTSNMVIQRDKPIMIWGWVDKGAKVEVQFGDQKAQATAEGEKGRWEVTFPAQEANATGQKLIVKSGDETVEMDNIVIGDVWVMNGQSNMAWGLEKTTCSDLERTQANLPLLRHFRIKTNEQATLQTDIPAEAVINEGWEVSTPETALGFSAIGYYFGSRVQRALQIPIGVIGNARGGASIESLVPAHKFDDHPVAKRYAESVAKRRAEFDIQAKGLEKWQREVERAKSKGLPEQQWPKKPVDGENLRSWDIPGKSPSDMASVYNGMFGMFKGYNIKGVVYHQGYNNAIGSNCRPERYRVLMKLMVEGWREDFNDPNLPLPLGR